MIRMKYLKSIDWILIWSLDQDLIWDLGRVGKHIFFNDWINVFAWVRVRTVSMCKKISSKCTALGVFWMNDIWNTKITKK